MPESPVLGMSPTHLFVPFVLFATWRARPGLAPRTQNPEPKLNTNREAGSENRELR